MIDFLVKHLSELLKSRPEDVLTLPYCLLQEVLKSDRLTSLSEEQIWQVRTWCLTSGRWDMIRKGRTLEQQPLFDEAWLSVVLKPCSLVRQVTEGYQVCSQLGMRSLLWLPQTWVNYRRKRIFSRRQKIFLKLNMRRMDCKASIL